MKKVTNIFERFSEFVSNIVGSPYWFVFSVLIVLIWFPTKFFVESAELWHLLINTTTTILTFLMMSLLHASQKKWEKRMENIQKREDSTLRSLKQETEQIRKGSPQQSEQSIP